MLWASDTAATRCVNPNPRPSCEQAAKKKADQEAAAAAAAAPAVDAAEQSLEDLAKELELGDDDDWGGDF